MGCNASKDGSQPKAVGGDAAASALPVSPQRFPYKVNLEQGKTYYWCSCGKSANQPYCDGSHQGTAFVPKAFTHDKPDGEGYLCGCKRNKPESGANCDGTHKNIQW